MRGRTVSLERRLAGGSAAYGRPPGGGVRPLAREVPRRTPSWPVPRPLRDPPRVSPRWWRWQGRAASPSIKPEPGGWISALALPRRRRQRGRFTSPITGVSEPGGSDVEELLGVGRGPSPWEGTPGWGGGGVGKVISGRAATSRPAVRELLVRRAVCVFSVTLF